MGKIIISILLVLALAIAGQAQATIVEFHNDWIIHEGDEYDIVYVYDDATLGITGGKVDELYARDYSAVNLFAGEVSWLYSFNSSRIYMYGGSLRFALRITDSSVANLFGAERIPEITIFDTGKLNIYGYGFEWKRSGGIAESGVLSGYWLDGTPFSIYLRNLPEPFPGSQIILIPEPSTLLLLALGSLMLNKRNHSR